MMIDTHTFVFVSSLVFLISVYSYRKWKSGASLAWARVGT